MQRLFIIYSKNKSKFTEWKILCYLLGKKYTFMEPELRQMKSAEYANYDRQLSDKLSINKLEGKIR